MKNKKKMKENLRLILLGAEMVAFLACCMALPYYFWQSVAVGSIATVAFFATGYDMEISCEEFPE